MNGHTDSQGQIAFDLTDGDYKFRVDYLGYQFWTETTTVPDSLAGTLTIAHQDAVITVNSFDDIDHTPLENIRVYLFKESGAYLGQYGNTDSLGQVVFNLPDKEFKVRVDYLGGQYWSDTLIWGDNTVAIDHGEVALHVTDNGADLVNVPVYLFSDTGSYLGRYERTDDLGQASFVLPAKAYKFRVDYNGTQYWSNVVNVIAYDQTHVDLALEILALDLTNDPNPVRFDGAPPIYEPAQIKVASLDASSIMGLFSQVVTTAIPATPIYYYINDHLGTPQMITDAQGQVVWQADYRPLGDADIRLETVSNSFRFPGQYFDAETGFHHNWHRYYDPQTGRYLTPDPIGLAGGINLYSYVSNNPVNFVDPWGLRITQVWRPLAGGAYGLGYHTGISVNGEIYGFTADGGVVREDPGAYNWGSHENEIYGGDEYDQAMLDYLRNAAAGNDPRFTEDTYGLLTNNCMSFAECAIREVLNNPVPPQEEQCH